MASCFEVAESSGNGNRRVADPQRFGAKCSREPEIVAAGITRRIFGQGRSRAQATEIDHLFQAPHELQRGRDAALQNPWEKFPPNRSTALAFCATRCILLQCGSGRFPRATVALLGRFLPRLGPLPQGERPLSFDLRFLARGGFRRSYSAAARYGRNSSSVIVARRSESSSNSLANRANEADRS
jgi:hypothetical protein